MPNAIYFPYTCIQDKAIIKNALLLWDSIAAIVPQPDWTPPSPFKEKLYNEATELVVTYRSPTLWEKDVAHSGIRKFVENGPAPSVLRAFGNQNALIYPEKFLDRTWHLLSKRSLTERDALSSDYGVPPILAFMMMSLLADACAGSQIQKVTDRVDAHGWLMEHRARTLGAEYVTGLDISQVAPLYDRLVTLSLEAMDARAIPIGKLVALRKREAKSSSSDYRAMRHRYHKTVARYVRRICKEARTKRDYREIKEQFRDEIRQDLDDLKHELGLASIRALLSKEVAISAIAIAGALVEPISGLTALATSLKAIGVAPLLKTGVDYRAARRKALQSHSTSWLFLTKQKALSWR